MIDDAALDELVRRSRADQGYLKNQVSREELGDAIAALRARVADLRGQLERANAEQPLVRCTCYDYQPGSLSGGWKCPLHGQRW